MALVFERFAPSVETAAFDSGEPSIDEFVRTTEAIEFERKALGRTYLARDNGRLVGFLTLAASSVNWRGTTRPLEMAERKRDAEEELQRFPAIMIGQLAVSADSQGQGYGTAMVAHVVRYARRPVRTLGIRLIWVHSIKKRRPLALYEKCGFHRIPYGGIDSMDPVPMYLDLLALD